MNNELPCHWQQMTLENCMEAIIDYRGKTPEKKSFGIPLITAKIVKNGQINNIQEYIATKDYDSWMRRGIPKPGDVVMTTEAPLGEIAQLDNRKVALAQRLITLRSDSKLLDNNYLKFLMQSSFVQDQLHARATGTTVLGIKQSELRKINLAIPPLPEQKAIARILSSLDDKIELNRQMNQTLEAIAQTIFKSWFVNFDPVRAKMEGKQPAGMDAATAALFPDEFEDSSLGLIPKGWRVKSLDEIANFLNGLALQKYQPNSEEYLPIIKISELRKGITEQSGKATIDIPSNYIIEDGDILFSWSGSLVNCIWCGGKGALNQHLFKVTSTKYPKWFYYQWVNYHLPEFQFIAAGKATTMGHIQRHHLTEAKVIVPPSHCLSLLDKIINPLIDQVINSNLQSRTLATIRDTLLPKLMSGEIRVKEAEEIVEDTI